MRFVSAVPTAAEIRMRRKELGWSQSRLAREAGVSSAYVCQIESGKRTPGGMTLWKIDAALTQGVMYPGPEHWAGLDEADKRLVQRFVNILARKPVRR